jgi:hypothetical protein
MADPARARIVWRIGLILLGGFLISFCIGFLLRNPDFFENAPAYIHQIVTGEVGGVNLNFKEPEDYLRLLNLDPKVVPGKKRGMAEALHDTYHELANGDSAEEDAKENLNRSFDAFLDARSDPNALASAKGAAQSLQETCRKRLDFYHGLEGSLTGRLRSAGVPADVAPKVSAAFSQKMGVPDFVQKTEQTVKDCDAKLTILDTLEKDRNEGQRGPSGEIVLSNQDLLKRFLSLFPDVPAVVKQTDAVPVLSPVEYEQRCQAIAAMPASDLPKSGDAAFEALCDTRVIQSLFNQKQTGQSLDDAGHVANGIQEVSKAYAQSGNLNEFLRLERIGVLFFLDYDRAGQQFLASLPKEQSMPDASKVLETNRDALGQRFGKIAADLASDNDTQLPLIARRRMAFLIQETFGRAKEFLDPSIAQTLAEAQQKDPDPMVQKALETALKQ